MKQIKEKIDKLPLIIRSIIYGMIVSTCAIAVVIFLLLIIYYLYAFGIKLLGSIFGNVVSVFILMWILMTLLISIIVFVESRR